MALVACTVQEGIHHQSACLRRYDCDARRFRIRESSHTRRVQGQRMRIVKSSTYLARFQKVDVILPDLIAIFVLTCVTESEVVALANNITCIGASGDSPSV